tara:strand:- start:2372 stop:3400 length:1029 start_codon:yes stop_codon:yes gene_type:complete
MCEKLKIGVLGLSHDHIWGEAEAVVACDEMELVAAADPIDALTGRFTETYGCPVYGSVEALLENETIDAAYVFGSNLQGADFAIQAMERGLHVLIEKPLAASLEDAKRMLSLAEERDVKLVVNWPIAWWPQIQKALQMAFDGELGDLRGVTYRAAHCGPEELGCSEYFCDWLFDAERNGGGAMMDYCCYGAVLAAALMGMPDSVTGTEGGKAKDFLAVEDSGVVVMKYPRGIATATASWTQIGNLTSYETTIYGSKGTLLVYPSSDGKLYWATKDNPDGTEVDVPELDSWLKNSARHFAEVVRRGTDSTVLCRADLARDAQEIVEAGIRSAHNGTQIKLPLG